MSLKKGQLSNGIRVVTEERELTGAVAYHVYFGCGGRHDPDERVGLSHAIEHMMFKGTPTRTQHDIARQMEGVGALINANTGTEHTCYHFLAPAEVFGDVLAVYADAINNSLLDPREWEKERGVILEELKMYQDMPRAWVSELLETTMFNLQVGVIGRRETIGAIGTEHMRELIARWYTPAQTVIAAAGRISHEQVVELSERHFGGRSRSTDPESVHRPAPRPRGLPRPPLPSASRQRVVGQVRETDQVNLALGFRAPGLNHPDAPAVRVLCDILGGKMSSRLFTEVREKRGLAYSVSAASVRFTDAGLVELKAGVALEKAAEALRVILAEAGRMKAEEVSGEELVEAKRHLRGSILVQESSGAFAGRNGSSWLLRGRVRTVEEELAEIEAVTAGDVRRVAGEVFRGDNLTLAFVAERDLSEEFDPLLRV